MITNILPLPVVMAIVARFDPDLDTLHFSNREVNIRVYGEPTLYSDGSWVVEALHISGQTLIITVSRDLEVAFDIWCDRCHSAPCECVG
jgi:hypothetical protein